MIDPIDRRLILGWFVFWTLAAVFAAGVEVL